jgi:8-oxo-dGTP diphosphatase
MEYKSARWLTKVTLNDVEWLPADLEVIEKIKKIIT